MKRERAGAFAVVAAALLAGAEGCARRSDGFRDGAEGPSWTDAELRLLESLSPLPPPPPSPTNPVADDDDAARLGRELFFDRGLGARGSLSCASCHQPERYFTDGRTRGVGLLPLARNTPTVIGAAYYPFLMWDGRKDSLWSQAIAPLEHPNEMGASRAEIAAHVNRLYLVPLRALFPVHEGGPPDDPVPFSGDEAVVAVARVLEAYVRRLTPGESAFDRYVRALRSGDPKGGGHLSASAVRGLRAFIGSGQCVFCHNGPHLSDGEFHNLGLPPAPGATDDRGRAEGVRALLADPFRCGGPHAAAERCDATEYLDPAFPDFEGAYKTPSLRNVAKTAPYMHGGQLPTLEAVVAFYKRPFGQANVGHRDLLLDAVDRDLPVADVVAFLESLTGPLPADADHRAGRLVR